jgi:hypothetical protein
MRTAGLHSRYKGVEEEMSTTFCQKCQKEHPGRVCDYDDEGECAETKALNENDEKVEPSQKNEEG